MYFTVIKASHCNLYNIKHIYRNKNIIIFSIERTKIYLQIATRLSHIKSITAAINS